MPTLAPRKIKVWLLAACAGSLVVLLHNFAIPLLPEVRIAIPTNSIQPETTGHVSHAYASPIAAKLGASPNDHCIVALFEDGQPLPTHRTDENAIRNNGHGLYLIRNGRLIFSASDNTDPRTNGRDYDAYYTPLRSRSIGCAAAVIFAAVTVGLYRLNRRTSPPAVSIASVATEAAPRRFKLHLAGAAFLLLVGLYVSTGTLSPYAHNAPPHVDPASGYLYNLDHVHFKVLFQFLDGADRSVWDGALFLRRILFPVLAYPFMKLWGFEIGGTLASLLLNVSGFIAFILIVRRFTGERAAVFAAWLLALYPGAAYWGGLPYVYSTIFPFSLLLTGGLLALHRGNSPARVAVISLLMGIAYLGYDLVFYFLPASILLLLWRRQVVSAVLSGACQVIPLLAWLMFLRHGLGQSLTNSNSATFDIVLKAYLHPGDLARWWEIAQAAPGIGLSVFFASNFIFLPAVFLLLLAVNAVTSRIVLHPVESVLLAVAAALFFFNHLAPDYAGPWQMRGTWISRLYQPIFPALVLFAARWFQGLPPLAPAPRFSLAAILLAAGIGNALIVFGPLLFNPLALSETAFFSFYDCGANPAGYEQNLQQHGRRPLGF
ncbi:MAG TPA: hypothetical protein VHO24_02965 [Opitutaceae bacterium]|nr:hypothetical protein [Opitutaceae bacterium]